MVGSGGSVLFYVLRFQRQDTVKAVETMDAVNEELRGEFQRLREERDEERAARDKAVKSFEDCCKAQDNLRREIIRLESIIVRNGFKT